MVITDDDVQTVVIVEVDEGVIGNGSDSRRVFVYDLIGDLEKIPR